MKITEEVQSIIYEFKLVWQTDEEFIGSEYYTCPFCKGELSISGTKASPFEFIYQYTKFSFDDVFCKITVDCLNCNKYHYLTEYSKRLGGYCMRYTKLGMFSHFDNTIIINYISNTTDLMKDKAFIVFKLDRIININFNDIEKTINKIKNYRLIE